MPDVSDEEVRSRYADILGLAQERDGAARLLNELPSRFSALDVATQTAGQRVWELAGLEYLNSIPQRPHEALAIFWSLYQHMLLAQESCGRVHKGMPLCWISDCFQLLGCPVHRKRYLQLTLCEDAIRGQGTIHPGSTGSYFRLVWGGMPDAEFCRYARTYWQLSQEEPQVSLFPEALLQRTDDDWLTAIPSAGEAFVYLANEHYVRWLLAQLGSAGGRTLEFLAEYLMSCMPGCRTKRRARNKSNSDYDVLCSMEGVEVDFRSELGRYFVCECKDWSTPADFTTMAKFCRVLDSFKAKFGILFSKFGVTGEPRTTDAAREQLKVFQDRGIVIVVINEADLQAIAKGKNLIALLRRRYEAVRLDMQDDGTTSPQTASMVRTRKARNRKK
jgi:hypothetical protein